MPPITITPDTRAAIRRMLRQAVFTPVSREHTLAADVMQRLLPCLVDSLSDETIDCALHMAVNGGDVRP